MRIVKNARAYQASLLDIVLSIGGIAAASISVFGMFARMM